jgi:HlyD family secretion protein
VTRTAAEIVSTIGRSPTFIELESAMSFLSSTLIALSLPAAAAAYFSLPQDLKAQILALRPGASAPVQPAFVYDTAPVSKGAVRKRVQTSGTVRPLVTVLVGSQLSGQIKTLKADFNSEVKEGDILALLDDKSLVSRVEQAAADLEMAKAQLANQQAALEKATSVLRQAERASGRAQELNTRGITAQVQLDTAVRDAEVARAEISVAKAQIDSARANVVQRNAMLTQAKIDLERTQIRAPIGGIVVSRTVEVGQTVAASLQAPELFRIAQDLKRIRIEALVNEADVGGVAKGNPVTFRVDAYPGRMFNGKVSQIRLSATEEQSVVTYTVVIEATNEDMKLYPSMTANVEIETDKRENVLRVPAEALRYRPRGTAAAPEATAKEDRADRQKSRLEDIAAKIGLSAEQISAGRERLAALDKADGKKPPRGEARSEVARDAVATEKSGKDGDKKRTSNADKLIAALDPVLSDAQRAALAEWKDERAETTPGLIWSLGADGRPTLRHVRIGLNDGKFAEVADGTLTDGEPLIVRSRSTVAKK